MLPPLSIPPDWNPPPDEGSLWSQGATPRDPPPALLGGVPSSPNAHKKTKSRAARNYFRTNSLKDAKVLVVSDLHRTESAMDPSLFQFHQHFEAPWQLVGKTHLSEVFRVRHRGSGQVFAVKRSRRRFRSKLQRERCLREIRAVAALPPHPNIVNQYRAWQEGGHFYIQMDYCEGGSLSQRAHECMTDEQLWTAACQTAQGLQFLHSHGVLHLDIKPENIYLAAGTWRIGDFGLAVARDTDGSLDWEEGDGAYVAPELLQEGGEPLPASDIFSLGATLFECATGRKLPRAEGWTAADLERLEVPGRPPAFVQLLQAMLQPSPAQRASAQQILDVVAHEQPATAAAAAEAVAASAQAQEASLMAACQAAISYSMPAQQAAANLVPSPFQQETQAAVGNPAEPRSAGGQLASQSLPGSFSFDVQRCAPGSCAFTPGQAPHPCNTGMGMPPGTAAKKTPVPRSRMCGRWAPALSPLISEGALTPNAAAALGLTPTSRGSSGGAPTPVPGQGASSSMQQAGATATPLHLRRPAPLQVPPQTVLSAGGVSSGSAGVPSAQHVSSGGTQDSREGWKLSRRDIISPDSTPDAFGSQSDSDYSYSCGTGKTMSDLDFADTVSPMSQELAGLVLPASGGGLAPSTATPESSRQWQEVEARSTPCANLQDALAARRQQQVVVEAAASGAHLLQAAPSLAWDLHTSPEFLMQLPPSSPDSLSRSSSLDDTASLPSRATSVRRFPTLDSWGSQLHLEANNSGKLASSDAIPTNNGSASMGAPTAPGVAGRGLRKRQHSSRRTLMAALSRDNSVASSIDGMQPQGKARHIMPNSAPSSPTAEQPASLLRMLPRTTSALGREAAAGAAMAGLAEAARALVAGAVSQPDGMVAGVQPLRFDSLCSAVGGMHGAVQTSPLRVAQSPLHARMTCMKLRDID